MKKALFIISIVSLTAVLGFGQSQKKAESDHSTREEVPQRASSNKKATKNSSSTPLLSSDQSGSANATGNAAGNIAGNTLNAGTVLSGELQNTIDVRRSKVGDTVVLKTVKALKQNGQTVVPKGTQLVGRVTEVVQKGKGNAESRIGMVFDRLEGRNLSQPISASIVSITNAAASVSAGDDLFNSEIMGSSSSSGSVSRGSTSNSGGGLLSGTGSVLGGATGTLTGVTNTATSTVGGVTDTATRTVGGTTRTLGNTTQGVGNTINGLRISGAASGSANGSSTVSSGDKNLHIDKGATFNLRVIN